MTTTTHQQGESVDLDKLEDLLADACIDADIPDW